MPAINVLDIAFDASSIDSNKLGVAITYAIPDIGVKDLLGVRCNQKAESKTSITCSTSVIGIGFVRQPPSPIVS